ncbi:AAC(3) family N-acetyltransferase [Allostreptomyces psammosilenae]|uniref:Aminoglycoside N(3)-acetyltransferase n=1 Tax=Allostreptomyces psammosilenae TaxID=1892865 RepID=A0A852ZX61_9ACTN|nr:AAC(3) family N-acetyltransferase [Allostreptomyces psammosilenae]NYI06789.1 aminoglycoside 3-N-acetyltransferase [Allostreptomyces psammosilenae]
MVVGADRLRGAAEELGLAARPVMTHTSLRSFGEPVEGGADALLDALLALGCTVLVPSFTWEYFDVPAPPAMRPARNGCVYDDRPWPGAGDGPDAGADSGAEAAVYSPDCGLVDTTMGALPAALIARRGARRGRHPHCSFAALGPLADELAAAQSPVDVYGPVRALAAAGGAVLLVGVGLNRMTALHLAEQRSGRRLFARCAREADGRIVLVESGGCSEGFGRLEPALRPLERTVTVGASRWRAYPAEEALDAAVAAITADQGITHCADPDCVSCADAVAGGPLGPIPLG